MDNHQLILREHLATLGWPGIAGLVALLAGLTLWAAVLTPAERALRALDAEVIGARQAATPAAGPAVAKAGPPGAGRSPAAAEFPEQSEVTGWIGKIYAAAADEKLSLARGEYQLAPVTDSRLMRYQISLPVRGDYPRIRRFIAKLLANIPNLNVDDVNLQRQSIAQPQVEGRIRLSLYLVRPS